MWAFLKSLRAGDVLSGAVASVERFGVFVDLDEGPKHPAFPGVGFITVPELSWLHFESASDVVEVGQRVACAFLGFDTTNGEARLSLRALVPGGGVSPEEFPAGHLPVAAGDAVNGCSRAPRSGA
ncbi:S1 RNA-binding domain-containing protein [Streptomyces sp. NPDC005480]|uniref:S1 RNA-binding domain-containing protein n=1 Tax=Streptomyces sp. NPDC005480 TaxID=3154880 RepID=UPI00339FA975